VEYFCRQGGEVFNLDISPPRDISRRNTWWQVDLCDVAALKRALGEISPQVLLHMGARTDLEGRSTQSYEVNIQGVANLLAVLRTLGSLERVVFASSRLVCRIGYEPKDEFDYCPSTPYGESKVVGENLVRAEGHTLPFPWVIVRPTSIWGPWFDVPYKTFFLMVAKGRYVHPAGRQILKSFGFVGNTVHQLDRILAARPETIHGKTLYLADYPPTDIARLAETIRAAIEAPPIRTVGMGLLRVAAGIGDGMKALGWRQPPLTSFRLENLITPMVHDLEPLREIAGELPFTMEQGVDRTVAWMREHGDLRL